MIHSLTHPYMSWLKWHYYMGKITGNPAYSDEATRMADVFWSEIRTARSPGGPAYVWAHSMVTEGGNQRYLHPTTYARYIFNDFVDFHLEGFHRWASDTEMARFARTVAWFVMDADEGRHPDLTSLAHNVGGASMRSGLRSPSGNRLSLDRFAFSSFGFVAAWDTSERVAVMTRRVRDEAGPGRPRVVLTASVFLETLLRGLPEEAIAGATDRNVRAH